MIAEMDIRSIVRAELKRRGWTPYDLWKATGGEDGPILKQSVYNYLNGKKGKDAARPKRREYSDMGGEQLGHLLDALGVTLNVQDGASGEK